MFQRALKIVLLITLATIAWQMSQWDFSFSHLRSEYDVGRLFVDQNPALSACVFLIFCILSGAIPFPLTALLTVAAGTFFGFFPGLVLALIGNTLGACLAFFLARWLFGQSLRRRFIERIHVIDEGLRRDGPLFLFSMRMVPVLPFFVTNILIALTPIPPWTFLWVSCLGLFPSIIVYVNAGARLALVNEADDLFSPLLWISFLSLALMPWLMKAPLAWVRRRRATLTSGTNP